MFSVRDISAHTAVLTVEESETYIYYLYLLQNDDVLYTSAAFHAVKARKFVDHSKFCF